jgi:hypothetical protein
VGLLGAAVLLTGCTTDPGTPTPTAPSAAPTRSTPPGPASPLDGRSAADVLAASRRALAAAPVVRVSGRLAPSGSAARPAGSKPVVTFDVTSRTTGDGSGWVSPGQGLGRVTLLAAGPTVYLRGDETYNLRAGGRAGAALLRGRWVAFPRRAPQAAALTRFMDRPTALTWLDVGVTRPPTTPGAARGTGTARATGTASGTASTGTAATTSTAASRPPGELDRATVTVTPDGNRYLVTVGATVISVARRGAPLPQTVRENVAAPRDGASITFSYPRTVLVRVPGRASVVTAPVPGRR